MMRRIAEVESATLRWSDQKRNTVFIEDMCVCVCVHICTYMRTHVRQRESVSDRRTNDDCVRVHHPFLLTPSLGLVKMVSRDCVIDD